MMRMRLLSYPELFLVVAPVMIFALVPLYRDSHQPDSPIAKEVYDMGGGNAARVPAAHLESWFSAHPEFAKHVREECMQPARADAHDRGADGKVCAAVGVLL